MTTRRQNNRNANPSLSPENLYRTLTECIRREQSIRQYLGDIVTHKDDVMINGFINEVGLDDLFLKGRYPHRRCATQNDAMRFIFSGDLDLDTDDLAKPGGLRWSSEQGVTHWDLIPSLEVAAFQFALKPLHESIRTKEQWLISDELHDGGHIRIATEDFQAVHLTRSRILEQYIGQFRYESGRMQAPGFPYTISLSNEGHLPHYVANCLRTMSSHIPHVQISLTHTGIPEHVDRALVTLRENRLDVELGNCWRPYCVIKPELYPFLKSEPDN